MKVSNDGEASPEDGAASSLHVLHMAKEQTLLAIQAIVIKQASLGYSIPCTPNSR